MKTHKLILFLLGIALSLPVFSQNVAPYDILINEFLPDPTPQIGLPNAEFIELFNRSSKTINLKDFKIVNGTVSTVLPSFVLKPAAYVVIYTKKTGIDFSKFGDTLPVSKLVALSNPNDTFYLAAPNGDVIDAVSYDLTFYENSKKADGGWSLERTQPNAPCNGLAWTASNDLLGGTPCKRNSVAVDWVDKTPPSIERYYLKDNKTLVVTFDKSLDRNAAIQTPQYQTLENIKISSAKIFSPFFNTIQFSFSAILQPKSLYNVVIKSWLKDCQNASLPLSMADTLTIQLPEKPAYNDLIINEILVNPEVNGSRFLELYNRSEKALDIGGLKIIDSTRGDVKTIATNFLLLPKQYVALTENPPYIQKRYKATSFGFSILKNKLPTWNETSGNVTIYAVEGSKAVILDYLSYDESWHNPLLASSEGVSLEKTYPNLPSANKINWQSAAEKSSFGTPAYKNSQYRDPQDTPSVSGAFRLDRNTFSPDDDGFEDALLIHYKLEKGGGLATVKIFDSNGHLATILTANEVLATEGVLRWQGERSDGTKASVGVYIMVINTIFPTGSSIYQKLPFALTTKF
ncbi:MAG: lamin tail domain-containing protein [Saprospiraceae bacterium]|nr:lamin tail domain-containing protein [Saprospiraceae bacterium]